MTKKPKDIKTIADLTPDGENFNRHTEFGTKLLEDSLRKFGAGRSILVDKDGNIIAGNSTTETAAVIGMEDVIVVPTDGKKLVVVQRTDLSLDSQKESGKAIYGKGYLVSEKAAAEKAAAEKAAAEKAAAEKAAATRWTLSEREKAIIAKLSRNDVD